jgi:hypothetical protein
MSALDLDAAAASGLNSPKSELPPLDPNGPATNERRCEDEYQETITAWRTLTSRADHHGAEIHELLPAGHKHPFTLSKRLTPRQRRHVDARIPAAAADNASAVA